MSDKHFGDTDFGQALGLALMLFGFLAGMALLMWATKS